MNNRIEETQEDQKGQEKIEFEDDINENSNIVEPGITSEQHTTASSGEHQIEKPRPEIGEEVPASTVEAAARSPSVSSEIASPEPNQAVQTSA